MFWPGGVGGMTDGWLDGVKQFVKRAPGGYWVLLSSVKVFFSLQSSSKKDKYFHWIRFVSSIKDTSWWTYGQTV